MLGLRVLSAAIVLLTSGSCAAPTTPSSQPSSTPEATRAPATTPAISIPPELIGTWESDLREFYGEDVCLLCGTEATLTLTEDGTYKLHRGTTTVAGGLSLDGERIVFLGNSRCSGVGAYDWTVEGDSLVMTSAERDECPKRAEALDGPTYTRVN